MSGFRGKVSLHHIRRFHLDKDLNISSTFFSQKNDEEEEGLRTVKGLRFYLLSHANKLTCPENRGCWQMTEVYKTKIFLNLWHGFQPPFLFMVASWAPHQHGATGGPQVDTAKSVDLWSYS